MPTTRSPAGSPSSVSECGLASGLWLKSTQAYRKMRRQHPLDHRQDAQLARGASQEAANRKPFPGDRQSPSAEAVSSLPAPLREVVGAPQDPSPLIFRQKPGSLSLQGHRFATARRSSQLVPLKRSLPLCATGRQEPLLQTLTVAESGGLLGKGALPRLRPNPAAAEQLEGVVGRQSGGASVPGTCQ